MNWTNVPILIYQNICATVACHNLVTPFVSLAFLRAAPILLKETSVMWGPTTNLQYTVQYWTKFTSSFKRLRESVLYLIFNKSCHGECERASIGLVRIGKRVRLLCCRFIIARPRNLSPHKYVSKYLTHFVYRGEFSHRCLVFLQLLREVKRNPQDFSTQALWIGSCSAPVCISTAIP